MTHEEAIEAACRAMHEAQGTGDADAPLQSGYQKSWEEPDSVRWKQWIETCEEVVSAYLKAMGSEPVAEIVSAHGDPEAFGERELVAIADIQKFPYRTKLFSAPPAPARDEEIERLTRERDELQQRLLTAYAVKAECNDEANFQRHRAIQAEDILAKSANGSRPLPYDREDLGRFVREAWVRWAATQPNPKPSWLVPYEELSEPDKEADRQIGEAVARWTLIGASAEAALQSERAGSGEAVRVTIKPLEWVAHSLGMLRAPSIVGDYVIGDRGHWWLRGELTKQAPGKNEDEAKACAQVDFDRRIRSALTVDADRPATGKEGELIRDLEQVAADRLAEAIEAAAKIAEQDRTPGYGPHKNAMEWLAETQRTRIAERIRALSATVTEGNADE